MILPRHTSFASTAFVLMLLSSGLLVADGADPPADKQQIDQKQRPQQRTKKKPAPFRWVNPLKQDYPGLTHATFRSSSMGVDVGYCIWLPPEYANEEKPQKRFPVVYYLHGGRPGSEIKSVRLTSFIDQHVRSGAVPGMIYVFVNGGPVSHYNMPDRKNAMGEDVFVKELIPHIDSTYRTIARRDSRGLEGFSQGGRGTTRIMFRHPHLFCSAAPGGAGHATEKRISEENGRESDALVFSAGYNTYDLARKYAARQSPDLSILIHVGTRGFNYDNNLAYMKFLDSLGIPYSRLIVEDAPHSAAVIYEKQGLAIMKFHARNFGLID